MQPLNIAVSDPLNYYYKKAVGQWDISNPGKIFTIYDIPACFVQAYHSTCNYQDIIDGLKKSEISPSNSNVFCEDEFLLSTVFEPISATYTNQPPTAEPEAMASGIEVNVDGLS